MQQNIHEPHSVTSESSTQSASLASTPSAAKLATVAAGGVAASGPWDPLHCADWDNQKMEQMALRRVQRDLQALYKDPPPGIFAMPDENDLSMVHALIVGPFDTPYEGGFFYLLLRVPPDYPLKSPRVRLMTTGNDTVRFNPNLYRNGKVCLSILGTWNGPSWTASSTLETVLLSIQSLMNERPYHNEPGYETEHSPGESERYNRIIEHETVRVAVCDMLEGTSTAAQKIPETFREVMRSSFAGFYDQYKSVCEKLIAKCLQGAPMADPFGERRGKFDPEGLIRRLDAIRDKLPKESE